MASEPPSALTALTALTDVLVQWPVCRVALSVHTLSTVLGTAPERKGSVLLEYYGMGECYPRTHCRCCETGVLPAYALVRTTGEGGERGYYLRTHPLYTEAYWPHRRTSA